MHGFKELSLLSLMLLCTSATKTKSEKRTTVRIFAKDTPILNDPGY